MVAFHPGGGAGKRLKQGSNALFKLFGNRFWVVDEVSEDDQFCRLPLLSQLCNASQIGLLTIAGYRNAMGLQVISFAQMHISDQQETLLLHPQRFLRQKYEGLSFPVEADCAHASLLHECKPVMGKTSTIKTSWMR